MEDKIICLSFIVNETKCIVSLKLKIIEDIVIDDILIDDINLFVKNCKGSGRNNNDANNKKRERILCMLPEIKNCNYRDYLKDERWKYVNQKFMTILELLAKKEDVTYDIVRVVAKGGRGYNFDFQVFYYKENQIIYTIDKVEFKNGVKLPQHLSLQLNSEYGVFTKKSGLYDEIFYEYYLPQIIDLYKNKNVAFPTVPKIEEYKQLVKHTKETVHEIFKIMKKNEAKVKMEKSKLVDASIHKYLNLVTSATIDFDLIQRKINLTQGNKIYILWDGKDFIIDNIKNNEMILNKKFELKYGHNKLANTLVLHTFDKNKSWECLLRWRNRKGILNPAWQIKLK